MVCACITSTAKAAATGMSVEEGVLYAWRVGCVANLVSGFIATLWRGKEHAEDGDTLW